MRVRGVRGWSAVIVCALTLGMHAIAHAEDAAAIAVWYRSGSGCPDGAAFLQALEARSVHARLAQVGDAIDFVVTLGGSDGQASSGVLERQTETGTVAIRRVDDPSCEQVAAALSLTLALAVQADAEPPAAPTASAAEVSTPVAAPPIIRVSAPVRPRPAAEHELHQPGTRVSVGVAGIAASGIAPGALFGGELFGELELGEGILRPALRLGLVAGYGSGTRAGEPLAVRILAGRIEACPIELGGDALAFRPCLAVDVGQLHSEAEGATGRSDSGLWLASELAARLTWSATRVFALEAQLGLALPWTRYTLQSGDEPPSVVHRTAALSTAARIGAVVHFP